MDKLTVMNEINEVLDTYCEGCFVKRQQVKDIGKTGAHQFCITDLHNRGTTSVFRE